MSTSDRTGRKLVDSLRKTKAAASGKDAASPAGEGAPSGSPEGATGRKGSNPPRRAAVRSAGGAGDPYQSGGRVWPD